MESTASLRSSERILRWPGLRVHPEYPGPRHGGWGELLGVRDVRQPRGKDNQKHRLLLKCPTHREACKEHREGAAGQSHIRHYLLHN